MAERPTNSPAAGGAALDRVAAARVAAGDELRELLHSAREDVLAAVLENPAFDRDHAVLLSALLDRKDLAEPILDRIAKRTSWMADAAVCQKLATHPRTPRRVATRLLREAHLQDLVQLSLQPATSPEARRLAEELIVGRIGQLPLGQKITLARRSSARVAGALLSDSSHSVVAAALDNSFLTEAQVLKALAKRTLDAQTVSAIGHHAKWSKQSAVRLALVTHPRAPLDRVMALLPELPRRDLEDLAAVAHLPLSLRRYLRHELARRLRVAKEPNSG